MTTTTPTALITGASKGFGLALAEALAQRGWKLIINARNAEALLKAQRRLEEFTEVVAISGDVRDEIHLLQFAEKLEQLNWKLNLIVNNASTLGVSPQPTLLEYPIDTIHQIFHTNVIAPLSLIQKVKSFLASDATIINLSSDAAAHHYENWGGYGAGKAALDHLSLTLGKEYPEWNIYAFDPGDMRTDMHQDAFPGEDISDRPLPKETAVPSALQLIYGDHGNGRYVAGKIPYLSSIKNVSVS